MMRGRQFAFWLTTFVVLAALLWLLRDILLPFVAGLALAYLQAPLADRLERIGINRTIASLAIVVVVVAVLIALFLLLVPLLLEQGSALVSRIPGYFKRVQELIVQPNAPWFDWLGPGGSGKAMSDLVSQVAAWLLTFSASLWAGGNALLSLASILIVMPIVTFYLICDWHPMIDIVDSWVPLRQRDTVRELAREIDAVIGGFLRGQFGVCLVLGCYYAIGLMLVGLDFGLLIGLLAGLGLWRRTVERPALEPAVLAHAWYIDEGVAATVSGPLAGIANGLSYQVDSGLIDGAINGLARLTAQTGRQLRRVQTGYVRNYALGIGIGAAVILAYVATRVGS